MSELAPAIVITGGKGGVGKTSLAANLAFALGALGRRVLLLDADYGLANLDVFFGVNPPETLNLFFSGERSLRQLLVAGPNNVRLIPAASGIPDLADLPAEMSKQLLKELDRLRLDADVLLVDTAAGIGHSVTRLLRAADRLVVVTCPDPAAILDAYALSKMVLVEQPSKPIDLVVNMVGSSEEGTHVYLQIDRACRKFVGRGIEYLGSVPLDGSVVRCLRQQRPLLESEPGSPAGVQLGRIALALNERLVKIPTPNESLVSFWGHRFSTGDMETYSHE